MSRRAYRGPAHACSHLLSIRISGGKDYTRSEFIQRHKTSVDATIKTNAIRLNCQRELDSLVQRSSALTFACLATIDGRNFACATTSPAISCERISAMTSSLLALSESLAKEALRSRCSYTALSIEHGSIILVHIPTKARTFTLATSGDQSENIATMLRKTLDTAKSLAEIIDRD